MNDKPEKWWSGTFPVWIVMVMMGIIGYGANDVVTANSVAHSALVQTVTVNSTRITRLEEQIQNSRDAQTRIEKKLEIIETLIRNTP